MSRKTHLVDTSNGMLSAQSALRMAVSVEPITNGGPEWPPFGLSPTLRSRFCGALLIYTTLTRGEAEKDSGFGLIRIKRRLRLLYQRP